MTTSSQQQSDDVDVINDEADNNHVVNNDDADNAADVTYDKISFKRNRIVKGQHGGGRNNGEHGSCICGGSSNYGKKKFCGKQKLCKTILNVIQFS